MSSLIWMFIFFWYYCYCCCYCHGFKFTAITLLPRSFTRLFVLKLWLRLKTAIISWILLKMHCNKNKSNGIESDLSLIELIVNQMKLHLEIKEEILNASNCFPVHYFLKFISCNFTTDILKKKKHSAFVFAIWFLLFGVCVFFFLPVLIRLITHMDFQILAKEFLVVFFYCCFRRIYLSVDMSARFLFVVNHFQWAPDLLIRKRIAAKIKWNLRECYYVIKNILNELLWEGPKWFHRTGHKKGWLREWKKKFSLQTEFDNRKKWRQRIHTHSERERKYK